MLKIVLEKFHTIPYNIRMKTIMKNSPIGEKVTSLIDLGVLHLEGTHLAISSSPDFVHRENYALSGEHVVWATRLFYTISDEFYESIC